MRDLSVAVFRPDDERLQSAGELVRSLGATPVEDPLLEVAPTGALPRTDAAVVVLTSATSAELLAEAGWEPGEARLAAIGPKTAGALEDVGYAIDIVADEYTSAGLVETLRPEADGACIEVARSDHGSDVLLEGLNEAGAYVHETVLYELVRPAGGGHATVDRLLENDLDVALFTSSLTVEHLLAAAQERDALEETLEGLESAVVGVIGPPTAETAAAHGIEADVVPEAATFDALATAAIERAAPSYHE